MGMGSLIRRTTIPICHQCGLGGQGRKVRMIRHLFTLLALALCAGCQATFTFTESVVGRQETEECSHLTRRREWRSMSREERASWIASVKVHNLSSEKVVSDVLLEQCLASVDHQRLSFTVEGTVLDRIHSLYDDFAIAHVEASKSAHKTANFLPWRELVLYNVALLPCLTFATTKIGGERLDSLRNAR